jgi:uncharacterized protein
VCPPIGHEYINSHRALRQLAALLANAGFPVLRFDYYGCGDSSGEEEQGSLSQWLEDTSTAVSELRRRTNLSEVCLVGLRLGATISLLVATAKNDVTGLVLWEAVTNGKDFLRDVLALQKQMMRFRPKPRKSKKPADTTLDLLGFAMNQSLRDEVEGIDILGVSQKPAESAFVIQSNDEISAEALCQHLRVLGTQVDCEHVDGPRIWETNPEGTLLVPNQVLRSILSWIANKHP